MLTVSLQPISVRKDMIQLVKPMVEETVETASITINMPIAEEFPVSIVDGKVDVNPSVMVTGQAYPVEYRGKRYFVEKVREDVIRVYELD